jgi:uncharacterized SAM-binding protein YcdF (DUF218 family)
MSFVFSKIVWALLAPGSLLLMVLALAFFFAWKRPRSSRALLGLALLFVAALTLTPIGRWVIEPLQNTVPTPNQLQLNKVDGIIVLGGAIGPGDLEPTGLPSLNEAAERMTAFVELAHRFPGARLVYTGGNGFALDDSGFVEADTARTLFGSLGLQSNRMVFENKSRNTWENAQLSQRILDPKPGETWLLVTSAWHMPRALGCFRTLGWSVVPYAVDYQGREPVRWFAFDTSRELVWLTTAVREWIGLVSYHLLGRSDVWLPGETRSDFRETPLATAPSSHTDSMK